MSAENTQKEGLGVQSEEKPSDAAVLFPDIEVAGYIVKPWCLGQATQLAPHIGAIRKIIKEEEVTFDNLTDRWMALIERGAWLVPKVIAVSLKISETEAEGLGLAEAGAVLAAIVSCNWRFLKNSLSPDRMVPASKRTAH